MTTTNTAAAAAAAAWKLSSSLKRNQLQNIATSIGAPISGTKPQLLSGIHELVTHLSGTQLSTATPKRHHDLPENLRVLSIDMGIRNLAFAFLTCQTSGTAAGATTATTNGTPRGSTAISFSKPELRQWRRIDLFNVSEAFKADSGDVSNVLTPTKRAKHKSSTSTSDVLAESFEPPVLAKHAYAFAKYCAGLRPTHILIERQRFRSAGHAAVLEWSLRVGMLESMLHSTFRTFTEEKILPSDVHVEAVLPMRVNKFWFADRDEGLVEDLQTDGTALEAKGGKSAKAAKLAKIAIVSDMLKKTGMDDPEFSVHGDAMPTFDAFMEEVERKPNSRKVSGQTFSAMEKLDDVSDSLLQGLAWLKWQENRRKLSMFGEEELGNVRDDVESTKTISRKRSKRSQRKK